MRAKEVLKLLKITRPTLTKYVRIGKVIVKNLPNGFYEYDDASIYKLLDKDLVRRSIVYVRVSTAKQKPDLANQIKTVEGFCLKNGVVISDIYQDIGSGINFDRKEFQRLLSDVMEHKIQRVFITYKDRLSRISFNMFKEMFSRFNCEIIVLNEIDDNKLVEKEIFTEIIDLIHCFAMKMYSNRRKEKLKLMEKELSLESEVEDAIS